MELEICPSTWRGWAGSCQRWRLSTSRLGIGRTCSCPRYHQKCGRPFQLHPALPVYSCMQFFANRPGEKAPVLGKAAPHTVAEPLRVLRSSASFSNVARSHEVRGGQAGICARLGRNAAPCVAVALPTHASAVRSDPQLGPTVTVCTVYLSLAMQTRTPHVALHANTHFLTGVAALHAASRPQALWGLRRLAWGRTS